MKYTDTKYALINQNNEYYEDFNFFKSIPVTNTNIHLAWLYPTELDAKQAIKDITEWTDKYKRNLNVFAIAKITFTVERL